MVDRDFLIEIPLTLMYNGENTKGGVFMMVSTKGRYAPRVMIDMAEHHTAGYLPLKEVAVVI